jgi:hypothetical protein
MIVEDNMQEGDDSQINVEENIENGDDYLRNGEENQRDNSIQHDKQVQR